MFEGLCLPACSAEIPHDPNYPPGSGTCETLYRSIDYMLNDVYAPCAFFNDAVVNGLSVAAANPGLVAYWNSLSVTYAGTTVGWQFSGVSELGTEQ